MKRLYTLIAFLIHASVLLAQSPPTLSWNNTLGGAGTDMIRAIAVDAAGNVYIGGGFTGTVNFNPNGAAAPRTSTGTLEDAFIAKYTPTGFLSWVAVISGTNADYVYALAADANSVYATGFFTGTANFNPNGTALPMTSAGASDGFIAKYNSTGINQFTNQFGSTSVDYGAGIALDPSGNIYVAGTFTGTVDFDPSTATSNEVAWGSYDIFYAKYNNSGSYLFSEDIGSTGDDFGTGCYVSGTDFWVTGSYSATRIYADPNDYDTYIDNLGGTDGYFGRYSTADGTLKWGGSIRSTENDNVNAVWADGTSLYMAGTFRGTATMYGDGGNLSATSKGETDAWVSKHTVADQKLAWFNVMGSTSFDYANALHVDAAGVHVTGSFVGTIDMDPSVGGTANLVPNSGSYDIYYGKYSAAGAYQTSFSIGGTGGDEGSAVISTGGYLYLAAIFQNTVDIDPSSASSSKIAVGGYDSFIGKYAPSEPSAQPTSLTFPNVTSTTFGVAFNAAAGGADGYLGVYKPTTAPTGTPVDGTTYVAGDAVGTGTVLFNNSLLSYSFINAAPSTQYFIQVYAYNGSGSTINYRTVSPLSSSFTTPALATEPTASPSAFVTSSVTTSSYSVSFTAAAGPPTGYIAIRATGTAPTTDPTDGVAYTLGNTVGNGTVAYVGTGTTFNETGLAFATSYQYKIYSYNGTTGTYNYRQTSPLTGTASTIGTLEPTAQPTNIVFSEVTATSIGYSFTASTGANVSGYVGIRKAGSAPTFVPVDGVELTSGSQNADGSVVAFVGSTTGTAWTFSSATANTTYYYAIYALNGTGTAVNYRQTNPLTGSVTTLDPSADAVPPVIVDNTATTMAPNSQLKITVTVTDNLSGVDNVYVDFYSINETDAGYGDLVKSTSGNTWEYTIPLEYTKEQGIEYNVYAYDVNGNSASTGYKQVLILHGNDGLTIPYSAGTAASNYRIISIPLDLQKKTVADVFADDLGAFDKTKYRLFTYANNGVQELNASSELTIGKGYWFIASEAKTVDTGPGTTAATGIGKPTFIPIVTGWNLIGNPFNVNVSFSNIKSHTDNADVTLGTFKTYKGSFATATSLEKFSGGFVMVTNAGDAKLRIPVDGSTTGRESSPTPENFSRSLDSDIWAVDLSLRSGGIENNFGGFGMHPAASAGSDAFDDYTLPRFMEYLELNYDKKIFNSPFTKDIVPTAANHSWEFKVASNLNDEQMELKWDNSFFGENNRQLVLWDVAQQRAIDMKSLNSYSFERSSSGTFKVFFGDENFIKTETRPYRAVFHSVSPVPSTGNVTLAFSVPESEGKVSTSVTIYNLMGQKMATIVDRPLPGGYQEAIWNIEDGVKPATGLYISILKFGDTTLQKRLIIK